MWVQQHYKPAKQMAKGDRERVRSRLMAGEKAGDIARELFECKDGTKRRFDEQTIRQQLKLARRAEAKRRASMSDTELLAMELDAQEALSP